MKVSVITVCYNAKDTIGDTIASVLSQKDVDLEYIIVDGGSTDGTVDLSRDAEARVLRAARGAARPSATLRWMAGKDQGMYDALNKGIARATGDIVGILNSDDVFEDAYTLASIVAAFADGIDATYADILFERNGKVVRYYSARLWKRWMHHIGYMPPHPSVYIRRGLFDRLGLYKLGYRISADFELMVRYFCKNRIRTKYLPRCVVRMRLGGMSTAGWRANILLNRENVRANRENGYFSCFLMMLPKYAYKILGYIFKKKR